MWAVCPFNINGKGHIYLYRWMYNTQKSTTIQCRGGREPRFFTRVQSAAPCASSYALPSPNPAVLSIMWSHQKPLVLLQGTYKADDNPRKWEGKRLEKGHPSFISSPRSVPSVTVCLPPGPTLQVEFALSTLQKDRTHRVQIVVAVTAQGAGPSFCYLQRM